MTHEEFQKILSSIAQNENPTHLSAISSAIARTHAIAVANGKLHTSLSNLMEDISDKEMNSYVSWLKSQQEAFSKLNFSGKLATPVKTNKWGPLLKELVEEIEKHDGDIVSMLKSIPNFEELAKVSSLPHHGAQGSWLGTAKATIYTTFMTTAIKYFGKMPMNDFNANSPVLEVYSLEGGNIPADSGFEFVEDGKLYIPHQGYAFGRGSIKSGIKAKDCGSWVQEVIHQTEKAGFPLATADWFGAIAAPIEHQDTEAVLAAKDWYHTDQGCKFLQTNFKFVKPEEVQVGDICVRRSFSDDADGLKKLTVGGHIGIVNKNIRGSEIELLSSNRSATTTELGEFDGIGLKDYKLDTGYTFFVRPKENFLQSLSSKHQSIVTSWEDLQTEIDHSSEPFADSSAIFPIIAEWDLT